jgi:hypothetical protein
MHLNQHAQFRAAVAMCCSVIACAVLRRANVNVPHDVSTGQSEPVFVVTQFARNVALAY